MSTPTTDYPGLLASCGAALAALEANDYLTARSKVVEAQVIILALGSATSADGTQLQLALDTVEQVMKNITSLEAYFAAKTTNGRMIRTGLSNGGRRGSINGYGGYGGFFHE